MAVTLAPIRSTDAPAIGRFLHAHLNERLAPATWAAALETPWDAAAPNHGYMLVDEQGEIAGVQLAFYAEREIGGRLERFCNLGAWCVLPGHRIAGLRLPRALLAQEGYHFTDLSPSGTVVEFNRRMRFRSLDTRTNLVVGGPWPTLPGRWRVTRDLEVIDAALTGESRRIFRDHREAAAAHHLLIQGRDGAACHVLFRRDRRKGLPLFASVLHVSDAAVFRRALPRVSRDLLARAGVAGLLVEDRVVGGRLRFALRLRQPRAKMFRSPDLQPAQIDDLYSELVCVAW